MFVALFLLINVGIMVTSIIIITGTCIYLRYKIIHSKRFFKSVKRSSAEEQKAVKVGRLMEMLQKQLRPTVTVFTAQGIDAVFIILGIIVIFVVGILGSHLPILGHILAVIKVCRQCSHAVVYGLHDKYIYKEIKEMYEKIRGPKKSKVIVLNGQ